MQRDTSRPTKSAGRDRAARANRLADGRWPSGLPCCSRACSPPLRQHRSGACSPSPDAWAGSERCFPRSMRSSCRVPRVRPGQHESPRRSIGAGVAPDAGPGAAAARHLLRRRGSEGRVWPAARPWPCSPPLRPAQRPTASGTHQSAGRRRLSRDRERRPRISSRAFTADIFALATLIHAHGSVLVGLLYGAMLPMLPRRPSCSADLSRRCFGPACSIRPWL